MNVSNSTTGAQSSISFFSLKHCRILVFAGVACCVLYSVCLMVSPCYDVRFTGFVFSDTVDVKISFTFTCSQAVMLLDLV